MKSSKRMGSFQLSAFCQTWIITIHRRVAVSCAESGQNCTDGLTINNELGTEALLQLSILHPDHHRTDRKSTRLNSSHLGISYAVFCLKKKNNITSSHT